MSTRAQNIKIRGIVSAVPSQIDGQEEYIEILGEKRVKKQTRLTGVKKRHINAWEQMTADLGIDAAKSLMKNIEWSPEDIRVLIFVTQSPSLRMPSTAFIIQKELNLSENCVCFDVNLGCSGFVTGLHVVSSLLKNYGMGAKGLLIVGDIQRVKTERQAETPEQFADRMLFGSAACATAVEICENVPDMVYDEKAYGERYLAISQRHREPAFMDGESVFEFGINEVVNNLKIFKKENKIDEVDYYVFHQAQKFMLMTVADMCDIEMEKMLFSLEEYGNTSSASIPVTICHNRDNIQKQESVSMILCGFGIGLACATVYLNLEKNCYLDIIETDNYYPF